jgi:hypothetical protein
VPDTHGRPRAVQINGQGSHASLRTVVVVNVKKIVGLLVVALLIYFVVVQPDSAATSLQNIGSILKNAADSVTRFFTRLV